MKPNPWITSAKTPAPPSGDDVTTAVVTDPDDDGEPVDGWTLCSPDVDEIVEALKMNGVV